MASLKDSAKRKNVQFDEVNLGKLFSFGKEFTGLSIHRTFIEIVETWLFLFVIIAFYLQWPNALSYCIALFLVASRQYALMILMHDGFHSLLHPNRKVNHFLSSVLLAYPCASAYWIARSSHLTHHRTLGKNEDPDRDLYITQGKESWSKLLFFFAKLPLGEQAKRTYGMTAITDLPKSPVTSKLQQLIRKFIYLLPVALFQLIILSIFYLLGSWMSYFTLWLLPLLLVTIFNGIRIFCEHGNITDTPGEQEHRLVSQISNPIERFFIAPFHMNYHAEHHLFPYVPHYNLPRLRAKIHKHPKLKSSIQWRQGYFSFLVFFLSAVSATERAIVNEE